MPKFDSLGVKASRKFVTNSTSLNVGGADTTLSQSETTELALTLPRPAAVRASFSREGLGTKLIKVFKKELQTGDRSFDDLVYISTDTPDATAALLQSLDTRATIQACVVMGGSLAIDGTSVTAVVAGHDHEDDPGLVRLCTALLG